MGKLIIKSIIYFFLHILWILPIDKKRIYFTSFLGHQFSCNPKYLYLYILSHNKVGYSFIWEFNDLSKEMMVPDAKVVKSKTLKALFYCITSKYVITNAEFPWYIPLRKNQVLLQTWHGGGAYKKVGVAVGWNRISNFEQKLNSKQISFYVSSSKKFTEVQSVSKCVPLNKFINSGMPRNSFLLSNPAEKKKSIYENLALDVSCKIVLYAPTYRGVPKFNNLNNNTNEALDYNVLRDALEKKFGGTWIILYRGHYYSAIPSISNNQVINVSRYDDMQELLLIADILITDYSSSMWDFSLLKKPVFLYATDIDLYDIERGFYTDPDNWPFSISKNNQELHKNIMSFDNKLYIGKVKEHHSFFGSYENIDSSKKIYDTMGIITE